MVNLSSVLCVLEQKYIAAKTPVIPITMTTRAPLKAARVDVTTSSSITCIQTKNEIYNTIQLKFSSCI